MGRADLHIHSTYSDGCATVDQILEYVEHHTDLDIIAITDHDCIDGALRARELATRGNHRVQAMIGVEISTRDGHMLGLGIEHLIVPGMSMAESIQAVHEQGGLAVIAHPLSQFCPSATLDTLVALASQPPDGLEVHNASFAGVVSNSRIRAMNQVRFGWTETGSSDAHTLDAIGSSTTTFLGSTAQDLTAAVRHHATIAYGGYWSMVALARYGYHAISGRNRMPEVAASS